MSSKKKNVWSDPFDTVVEDSRTEDTHEAPQSGRPDQASRQSGYIQQRWTDRTTGAEYLVKERLPEGPQGDFRTGTAQAEARYRSIMGLPATAAFHDRPVDDPFAEDRFEPEPSVNQAEIERKIRARATFDTQREQALKPTEEPATWAAQDSFTDHGEFVMDPQGRIRDKPYNTIGPFGTVDNRGDLKNPNAVREVVAAPIVAKSQTTGLSQNVGGPQVRDAVEERLAKKDKLQNVLQQTWHGLFGSAIANNMQTGPSHNDRRLKKEKTIEAKSIFETGLTKPWAPPTTKTDRPSKPEQVEYAVGSRVMASVLSRKLVPELQGLPKQDKDDLTLALGRAVLNAMTSVPDQAGDRVVSTGEGLRQDLVKSIQNVLSPEILKGLVAPELLQDRRPKTDVEATRVTNPGAKATAVPQRQFDYDPPEAKVASVTRPTLGQFSEFGPSVGQIKAAKKKKALFDLDESEADPVRPRQEERQFYGARDLSVPTRQNFESPVGRRRLDMDLSEAGSQMGQFQYNN
jgi:hypothetical protein